MIKQPLNDLQCVKINGGDVEWESGNNRLLQVHCQIKFLLLYKSLSLRWMIIRLDFVLSSALSTGPKAGVCCMGVLSEYFQ